MNYEFSNMEENKYNEIARLKNEIVRLKKQLKVRDNIIKELLANNSEEESEEEKFGDYDKEEEEEYGFEEEKFRDYDKEEEESKESEEESLENQISNIPNLYVTPIARVDGYYKSKRDYELQMENLRNGIPIYWDGPDPRIYKNPLKGDYFMFWHYENCVNIHKIINIFNPHNRLESWSDNVGHSNRCVLELSFEYKRIEWDDYINKFDGHKRCMGTKKVSDKRSKKIIEYMTRV